jgi:ABC transporter DrrB family efflux protein
MWLLVLARVREFYREPHAIFWVYGFPLLMAMALGVAFRSRPVERIRVDVVNGSTSAAVQEALAADERMEVTLRPWEEARLRLRDAKTDLVLVPAPGSRPGYEYWFEPNRPESVLARSAVDSALLRAAAPAQAPAVTDHHLEDPGSRYIDFFIPGLLGMNLMGGGLWGVGFVLADMRIRKLLKRFIATPMRKSDFLVSLMLSRMAFTVPEVLLLLGFGYLAFGVAVRGNLLALGAVIVLGAVSFAGLGLLVASRVKTVEAVSGLMNLVMLPMYILSGVFFSSERFPEAMQPLIKALPLTALIDSLRAIMLQGTGLAELWAPLAVLAAWGGVSYVLALRWFRWQ